MPTKSVAKKKDYAPMVVFELNTRPQKGQNHLTVKKQHGFKKKPNSDFSKVRKIVSFEPVLLKIKKQLESEKVPKLDLSEVQKIVSFEPVLYVIEYKKKIIGAIAAPPNSCYSTDENAFPRSASKAPDELHLYNPCHRTQTGAWV